VVTWLHFCGPLVRQNIVTVGMCGGGGCLPHDGREVESEEGTGASVTFKTTSQ
jgi:hypothetical protein